MAVESPQTGRAPEAAGGSSGVDSGEHGPGRLSAVRASSQLQVSENVVPTAVVCSEEGNV